MNGNSATRAKTVLAEMHAAGITDATGVPCSLLAGLFIELEGEESPLSYHPAPREDTALGLASGLTLGGRRTVALMQNSGLGYCLNVITSFTLIYELHLPLIISWRGHDGRSPSSWTCTASTASTSARTNPRRPLGRGWTVMSPGTAPRHSW
jgi:sulfopyruvate decarboxylase subunit alpha